MTDITRRSAARDSALDVAKGVAIVTVVFVHVWRGAQAAGLSIDPVVYYTVDTVMCLWVLTLFAFVAGLFIERGMLRDGPGRYSRRRLAEFLWLYVIWSLLNNLSNLVGSKLANTPVTVEQSLSLWAPRAQMWYLGWIALMVIVAGLARPWESRTRRLVTLVAVGAASLACWGLNGHLLGTVGLGISIAFFAGVVVGPGRALRLLKGAPVWVHALSGSALMGVTVSFVALGLVTPPTHLGAERTPSTVVLGVAVSVISTLAMLQLAKVLSVTPLRRTLAYLGEASMVVFLAHLLFTPTTRIVLTQLGVTDLSVHLGAGVVAGVAGPVLLAILATRLGAPWLFVAPRWLTTFDIRSPRGSAGHRADAATTPVR